MQKLKISILSGKLKSEQNQIQEKFKVSKTIPNELKSDGFANRKKGIKISNLKIEFEQNYHNLDFENFLFS